MDSLKQALFFAVTMGLIVFLAACNQQRNVITDDDMVATDGTITNIEYEGNEHAMAGLQTHVSNEDAEQLPGIESFDVDDASAPVHLSNRTEVYIKHLSSYLRVNQSYLKNDIDVTVYEELDDDGERNETVASKIVIQSKDMSITGKISNVNDEEQTFFISGEDGHYESGTRFNYDPATEVLLMSEEQEYERYTGDLELGLIVEVIPRSKIVEGIPAQSDTARIIIHEEENEDFAEAVQEEHEEENDMEAESDAKNEE
ncbi:hypothetical protein ACE1TH_14290 [Shouchella sp. JSM 1781072]|uniref:hypothetical protein n=1 Tax=Shouchella sp. JSM 1781072 TaxID=3344581 RepID=UPI0035C0D884